MQSGERSQKQSVNCLQGSVGWPSSSLHMHPNQVQGSGRPGRALHAMLMSGNSLGGRKCSQCPSLSPAWGGGFARPTGLVSAIRALVSPSPQTHKPRGSIMGHEQDGHPRKPTLVTVLGMVWRHLHVHTPLLTNKRLNTQQSWQPCPVHLTNPRSTVRTLPVQAPLTTQEKHHGSLSFLRTLSAPSQAPSPTHAQNRKNISRRSLKTG